MESVNTGQMKQTVQNRSIANIRDSIFHALTHFSKFEDVDSDSDHHGKWAVLSAHHAVEIYLKVVLEEIDPNNEILSKKFKNRIWSPSVGQILPVLEIHKSKLAESEVKLIEVVSHLSEVRHDLMHSTSPSKLDVGSAAWCMLAILRAISLRFKIPTKDIFDQSPPIEASLFRLLKWEHQPSYIAFVEAALLEEFPDGTHFSECPLCGASAVSCNRCEGCFVEMETSECVNCGEEFPFPQNLSALGIDAPTCPFCEHEQSQLG